MASRKFCNPLREDGIEEPSMGSRNWLCNQLVDDDADFEAKKLLQDDSSLSSYQNNAQKSAGPWSRIQILQCARRQTSSLLLIRRDLGSRPSYAGSDWEKRGFLPDKWTTAPARDQIQPASDWQPDNGRPKLREQEASEYQKPQAYEEASKRQGIIMERTACVKHQSACNGRIHMKARERMKTAGSRAGGQLGRRAAVRWTSVLPKEGTLGVFERRHGHNSHRENETAKKQEEQLETGHGRQETGGCWNDFLLPFPTPGFGSSDNLT
uniref:Uncharacterized protein n=1 Tax=Sphaerodactylus townsendi TaxID=933632 RepID=A0ACB8EP41_9SAUR